MPSLDDNTLDTAITTHLLEQVKRMEPASLAGVNSWGKPADSFSGSVLLKAPRPSGGINILLGDFTGHGLPAAIGILPVAEVFYGMTEKGFGLSDIIEELNKKLCFMLPESLFCSACLIELDKDGKMLAVWNGGLPELIVIDAHHQLKHQVKSSHIPLGVTQQTDKTELDTVFIDVDAGDKVYLYTQGLSKVISPQEHETDQALPALLSTSSTFSALTEVLEKLVSGKQVIEDILLVELDIEQIRNSEIPDAVGQHHIAIPPSDWKVNFELSADVLKHLDIVPLLTQVVMTIQAPQEHKQRIYTILAEMCSNALEHGILKLDSGLKQHANGFAEYYALRSQRLTELEDAEIKISLVHKKTVRGGELTICVEDSGDGFDYQRHYRELEENKAYCGRGEALLRQLCEQYFFSGKGNIATAVYCW